MLDAGATLARPVAMAVLVAAAAMLVGIAARAGEAVEAVTPMTLGVAGMAALATVVGAGILTISRHRDLALLSATASVLMVATLVLSIFGVLVLPLAVVTVVVLARRASGRRGTGLAIALLSGPLIAVGAAALLAIWVQPPLVECRQNGVETTSRPWWDSESGSGTYRTSA